MKKFKLIISLLLIISLTACVGQRQLNINEFLKKYNLLSGEVLNAEMFAVSGNEEFVYSLLHGQSLLCLYCTENGEIIQCTVTAREATPEFERLCINIISTFTDLNADEALNYYKTCGVMGKYSLVLNDYGIGKTMILNEKENPLNTNNYPTLKKPIDEEDIARPTLSDNDVSIKQQK